MNELALFAGAGGGLLAGRLLGWKTICAVENNPFCIDIIQGRQEDGQLDLFPIWDDIHSFKGSPWRGEIDIISGGFPFQAFSTATHGCSTDADLWPEMYRVIDEVDPKLVFAENVSIKAINKAAYDCSNRGYYTQTIALSAEDLGADHRRQRYWLLAYSDHGRKLLSQFYVQTRGMQKLLSVSVWEKQPDGWGDGTAKERYKLGEGKTRQVGKVLSVGRGSPEPDRSGVANGLASWVDRYAAVGNGQVPIVAAAAFLILVNNAIE